MSNRKYRSVCLLWTLWHKIENTAFSSHFALRYTLVLCILRSLRNPHLHKMLSTVPVTSHKFCCDFLVQRSAVYCEYKATDDLYDRWGPVRRRIFRQDLSNRCVVDSQVTSSWVVGVRYNKGFIPRNPAQHHIIPVSVSDRSNISLILIPIVCNYQSDVINSFVNFFLKLIYADTGHSQNRNYHHHKCPTCRKAADKFSSAVFISTPELFRMRFLTVKWWHIPEQTFHKLSDRLIMGFDQEFFVNSDRIPSTFVCPICTGIVESPVITPSQHLFCESCLIEW